MPPRNGRYDGRPMRRARKIVAQREEICWRCGKPIDDTLRSPHPMSRTVDHVTPAALGGPELDTNNMRAAHRLCNQRRGIGRRQPLRRSRDW
jgi:5-methylcytosine-specific restriction endonuclease McrA